MRLSNMVLFCSMAAVMGLAPQSGRANMAPVDYSPPPSGGVVAPKSEDVAIRLESEEVTIRLKPTSYTVDAVFHLFNTGDRTTEWLGFPKNAVKRIRQRGVIELVPDFLKFGVTVNGRNVPFKEERSLANDDKDSRARAPFHPGKYTGWVVGRATFAGYAETTIRVKYQAHYDYHGYGCSSASYIYGTGRHGTGKGPSERPYLYWTARIREEVRVRMPGLPTTKTRRD
ncbi:hypothetical protein ACFL2Q_15200 [Thermodesulfobacteriota bacterium]